MKWLSPLAFALFPLGAAADPVIVIVPAKPLTQAETVQFIANAHSKMGAKMNPGQAARADGLRLTFEMQVPPSENLEATRQDLQKFCSTVMPTNAFSVIPRYGGEVLMKVSARNGGRIEVLLKNCPRVAPSFAALDALAKGVPAALAAEGKKSSTSITGVDVTASEGTLHYTYEGSAEWAAALMKLPEAERVRRFQSLGTTACESLAMRQLTSLGIQTVSSYRSSGREFATFRCLPLS